MNWRIGLFIAAIILFAIAAALKLIFGMEESWALAAVSMAMLIFSLKNKKNTA